MNNTDLAKDWLNAAKSAPYMEIEITEDRITISISKEARDLMEYLREGGIEYGDPDLILCG